MLPAHVYPFDGYEATRRKEIGEQHFDNSCPEYRAIDELMHGNIEPLKKLITEKPDIINSLQRITKEVYYCTFLQVAAFYHRWAACAELWNSGANWAIQSQV